MKAAAPELLVLWDIDSTLMRMDALIRSLYDLAFVRTTNHLPSEMDDYAGQTDNRILLEDLRRCGLDQSVETIQGFRTELFHQYAINSRQIREQGRLLPGTHAALSRLANDSNVVQTVVTGNYEKIAAMKLEAFDLARFLKLSLAGYGDDLDDRAQIVRLSIRRAEEMFGRTFPRHDVVVVGDTVHDVDAANRGGACVVGVAGNDQQAGVLTLAGAPIVIPDLTEVVRAINVARGNNG